MRHVGSNYIWLRYNDLADLCPFAAIDKKLGKRLKNARAQGPVRNGVRTRQRTGRRPCVVYRDLSLDCFGFSKARFGARILWLIKPPNISCLGGGIQSFFRIKCPSESQYEPFLQLSPQLQRYLDWGGCY